jgi:Zn finger protein HypA/HybF involved in hydrogenase expression
MHEWGTVTAAVREAAGALRRPAADAELRIAPSVDPDVARGAFTAAAAGTLLQGATVHVRVVWHELACLDCARRYPGARLTPCPACGGDGLVVSAAPEAEVLVPAGRQG